MDELSSESIGKLDSSLKILTFTVDIDEILGEITSKYTGGEIFDYDYVGLYILLFLSFQRPGKAVGGMLKEAITLCEYKSVVLRDSSRRLYDRFDSTKKKWFDPTMTVVDAFNRFRFVSVPDYVNRSIVNWSLGKVCNIYIIISYIIQTTFYSL
jgi:hypothetical protein